MRHFLVLGINTSVGGKCNDLLSENFKSNKQLKTSKVGASNEISRLYLLLLFEGFFFSKVSGDFKLSLAFEFGASRSRYSNQTYLSSSGGPDILIQ